MKQFPTKQRASTRIGPHPKCILELMTGNLLGDGSLEKRHNATRFVFSQEEKNMEYLYWLHKQFAIYGYCSQKKPVQHTRVGKRNTVCRTIIRFRTWSYSSFHWYYDAFYPPVVHKSKLPYTIRCKLPYFPLKRQKKIPEMLHEWLTPQSLAVWFMDDGSTCGNSGGLKIATHCFTKNDLQRVQHILNTQFNLSSKLHSDKHQYVLAFGQKGAAKFASLILPWLHPSMKYKIRFVKSWDVVYVCVLQKKAQTEKAQSPTTNVPLFLFLILFYSTCKMLLVIISEKRNLFQRKKSVHVQYLWKRLKKVFFFSDRRLTDQSLQTGSLVGAWNGA